MTATLDFDAERDASCASAAAIAGDHVDVAFSLIRDHISGLEPHAALARVRRYQGELSALQIAAVAKLNRQTGSDRASKRALNDGKTSNRSIAKAAKRGDVAAKNAELIDKVAAGGLSEEQLDVIADASAKSDGAAAVDTEFIDEIAGVDPDQARGIAEKYLANRADPEGTQTEHDRQRRIRRAVKYVNKKDNLPTISLGGDGVATKNMWAKIVERANELYEADGGRDFTGQRPRTYEQRMFDAAYELICGVTTTPTGTILQARGSSKRGTGRPQIFVGLTLEKYLGLDPAAMAEQIGLGLIPDSVLAEYLEHADIIGVLYDKNGQPLWMSRTKRHATLMQRYALIARDKACVKCGADHAQCEVHHLMPWNAPGKGETNLDELALLCGRCHRELHANNHTLYQDHHRHWRTRPATPNETPPARPEFTQRE